MAESTQEIHSYLTTSPGSHYLNRPVTMLTHWDGTDNLLWQVECGGQEAVVKYYLDAGQARGRREFDGQERFSRFGIAPRPLWFDRYPTGLSRQLLVYQWLPGDALTQPTAAQLVGLANAVAQVHRGDPTEVRRFSPNPVNLDYLWKVLVGGLPGLQHWLLAQGTTALSAALLALTDNAAQLIAAALPLWQGVAPTPIHGDLKLENALDSFGTVVLLDWEQFGLGDAAYDVATFLQMSQAVLDAEAQGLWLESYLATFDQAGLAARVGVYSQILPLQSLTYLLHGLRQSTGVERTAIQENRQFFQETLLATWQQSAAGLGIATPAEQLAGSLHQLI